MFPGEEWYALQLESLQVYPDPPKPGHDLTVVASGFATEVIEVGRSLFRGPTRDAA